MQTCVGYLPRKSFNTYGRVLLTLFAFFSVVVIGISASFAFDTSFHCYDKTISKTDDFSLTNEINIKCSLKYQEKFRNHLIFGLLLLNFGVVLVLSIIYGYLVKHRVEKFNYPNGTATSNNQDVGNEVMVTPRDVRGYFGLFSTFFIYIMHLIVARILPLLIFAIFFYLSRIPENFSCPYTLDLDTERTTSSDFNVSRILGYNLTFIGCINPVGGKSKTLLNVVATVNIFVVTLTCLELFYIAWIAINDRDFITDQEFCTVYLLRKRKRIRKMIKVFRERFNPDNQGVFELQDDFGETEVSLRNLVDIYVNFIIVEGKENMNAHPGTFEGHGIYSYPFNPPNRVIKLTNSAEIFKPNNPRTILVLGRPGIGKTMLTKKLLQQWKQNEDKLFWYGKVVILLQLRIFNNKNVTLREMLAYGEGVSSDVFERIYNLILQNPAKTVLIFDGLDELDVDSSFLHTKVNESQTQADEKMPAFEILRQLCCGNFLSGVQVLITSRPTARNALEFLNFDRTVEILGFFDEQIREYVFQFCKDDNETGERIWNHIQESAELLSLCYTPVNSYIACLTLKESTEKGDTPKTITELYKRAVKVLIYRHHPIYKLKPRPSDYLITSFPEELRNEFSKLKSIAKYGIEEGKLIFERTTRVEFDNLANCGFFGKIPDTRGNYYCFLNLTLQEFFAASKVIDDMANVGKFFHAHISDPKWHLVIRFVAGLVGDKIKEAKMAKTKDSRKVMKNWERVRADIQKRYYLIMFSRTRTYRVCNMSNV
jgi:GTPase SAR1 family protein